VQDRRNGLLVEPGSPEKLAAALAELLGTEEMRARFREAGRATVETRYSFATRMEKLSRLYDEMLK